MQTASTLVRWDPSWNASNVIATQLDLGGPWACILDHVLTPDECHQMIAATESRGYEMAQVNVGNGRQVTMPDIRNSDRCIVDSIPDADILWHRVRAWVPDIVGHRTAIGLNERLRFLRYTSGQYFAPHMDGSYMRDDRSAVSLVTLQLYLNDVEPSMGGSTRFFLEAGDYDGHDTTLDVTPRTGRVLLFVHRIMHEGAQLLRGVKYACRTDVMYTNS